MSDVIGTTIGGYRIAEQLHDGNWRIYRGHGDGGTRVLVTIVPTAPPTDLALPVDGVPLLRAIVPLLRGFAVVESEPSGWRIGDLKWPLPIDEVITVGLDLARVLHRMHQAGLVHGALRPQLTWIDRVGDRSVMTGTTPRPERAGGDGSPFANEPFDGDDVTRLGRMLLRMATGRANATVWPAGDARMRAVEDLARTAHTLAPILEGLERLA